MQGWQPISSAPKDGTRDAGDLCVAIYTAMSAARPLGDDATVERIRAVSRELNAHGDKDDAAAIDALLARIEQDRKTIRLAAALVAKLDECAPHITAAFQMMEIHGGGEYSGPQYGEELKALRAALTRKD